MTVNTVKITSGPYAGNDVADQFSYTFRINNKSEIYVWETTGSGDPVLLTVDTDYTVAGIGDDDGGLITRTAGPLPTGSTWYIRSNFQPTQLTEFSSQGAFFPDVHEDQFDKTILLIQQLEDGLSRTLKLDDSYTGDLDLTLPPPVSQKYLRWKGDLSGLENVDLVDLPPGTIVESDYVYQLENYAAVRALNGSNFTQVSVAGRVAAGDGGEGIFVADPADSSSPDDGWVTLIDASGGRWKRVVGGSTTSLWNNSGVARVYVATTGSDSNSGTDVSSPFLTLQRAADFITSRSGFISGKWEISVSAGTYAPFSLDSASRSDYPVDVKGPDVGGHPNVPTAIIDVASAAGVSGFTTAVDGWVRFYDIKVDNATTGNAFQTQGSRLSLTNCHMYNCRTALANLHGGFVSVFGGVWDGNNIASGVGYNSFYCSTHDFTQSTNDPATDALTIKNFDRGMLINEGVQGHMDNVNILNCNTGVNFKRGAGATNTKTMKIDGCGVGVLAENNGWFNNGILFGSVSPNTVNARAIGSSPELSYLTTTNTARTMRLIENTNLSSHTGTTTQTTIHETAAIPSWCISEAGNVARVTLSGSCSLAGNATVSIAVATGVDTAVITRDIPSGSSRFYIVAIIRYTSTTQTRSAISVQNNLGSGTATTNISTIPTLKDVSHTLKTKLTLANAVDSVTIESLIYETTVGG